MAWVIISTGRAVVRGAVRSIAGAADVGNQHAHRRSWCRRDAQCRLLPLPLIAAFRISIRQCRAAFRISIRIRIRISILISIRVSIRRFSYFLWREDPPGGKEDKEGGRTPWGTNSIYTSFLS